MIKKLFLLILISFFLTTPAFGAIIDNLVSYWKLDESSGDAIDAHASNDGTITGATQGATGKINDAYSFDGDRDYVDMGAIQGASSSIGSVSVWFIQPIGDSAFLLQTNRDPNRGYIQLSASVGIDVNVRLGSGGFVRIANDIAFNVWHHLVFTWDNGNWTAYVDGVQAIDSTYPGTVGVGAFNLGRYSASSAFDYAGKTDEVGIWDKVLTQDEVTELYNSGDGLAYPFEEVVARGQVIMIYE